MNEYEFRLNHCIYILNSFPRDCKSLTVHVEDYFKEIKHISEEDKTFIVESFAEIIKYHKILHSVIEQYYELEGRTLFLKDKTLYFVILFFIVFRMNEINIHGLRNYFATQKINVMHRFLQFVIDENNLFTWIEYEWKKLYDTEFVENELMSGIKRWLPDLQQFCQEMQDTIDNKQPQKKKTVATTKPSPFNLTTPKAKKIPMPELIPIIDKPRKVPNSTYEPSENLSRTVKKDPHDLLKEAEKQSPSCADKVISTKTLEKMNNYVQEKEDLLNFNGIKAKPVPKSILEGKANIKLTTATILREWELYQKKQNQKIKSLQKLEEGSFNTLQFQQWQQKMREEDLVGELADLERRRLEGKISYEEAIMKKENLRRENKLLVAAMKKENERRLAEFEIKRQLEFERAKATVETITAGGEAVKEARQNIAKEKKMIAREIAEESKRLQEAALIEAEMEMRKKLEIIAEIRALEGSNSSSQAHHKLLDPTEVCGYGFLGEMSLSELKERLALSKLQNQEYLEDKRKKIVGYKQQKDQELEMVTEKLDELRIKYKQEDRLKCHENKMTKQLRTLSVEQEHEVKELEHILEEKKAQRLKIQQKNSIKRQKSKMSVKSENTMAESLDRYKLTTRSETVNKMSQILSI